MTYRRDYVNYVDEWTKRPENSGASFTMGRALYDFCSGGGEGMMNELGIEDTINGMITNESGASYERVEGLNDRAKLELVDISLLDELGRWIEDEVEEEDKREVFNELDSYAFVEKSEIVGAIEHYFYPSDGDESPSYGELSIYADRADEYIEDRGLEFDREGN